MEWISTISWGDSTINSIGTPLVEDTKKYPPLPIINHYSWFCGRPLLSTTVIANHRQLSEALLASNDLNLSVYYAYH